MNTFKTRGVTLTTSVQPTLPDIHVEYQSRRSPVIFNPLSNKKLSVSICWGTRTTEAGCYDWIRFWGQKKVRGCFPFARLQPVWV